MTTKLTDGIAQRRGALAPLLRDPSPEVRTAAATALERIENNASLVEVMESLQKGGVPAKIKAIYALGKIGGEQVLPPLIYCAARPEEGIKSAAIEVLGELADPKGLPVLIEQLKDDNTAIVAKVIAALGNFQDPRLVQLLIPFLNRNDGLLDAEAALSLGKMGVVSQQGKLIELLSSPHAKTREAAATALGTLPVS